MIPASIAPQHYRTTGYQMIKSIEIRNFRCFKHLKINDVSRLNVIVGDNGSGKTALLESVFFPLGATTRFALRFRQQRGLDSSFAGSARRVEGALWGELFHNLSYREPIRLSLTGDGPESRSLIISRDEPKPGGAPGAISLTYKDSEGTERILFPEIMSKSPEFPETGEDLPDFFYFPASGATGSIENAERFSDLSRARKQQDFVDLFANEYKWLQDLNIEVVAGSPALFGSLDGMDDKIALPNISGGINRMVAILLAIASRPQSIVLVDEIENGVYYKHQPAIWRGLLRFLREHDGQMLVTTHSKEWLEALVDAAGDQLDDIALWRVERGPKGPEILHFAGDTLKAGIEHGSEIRSHDDSDD